MQQTNRLEVFLKYANLCSILQEFFLQAGDIFGPLTDVGINILNEITPEMPHRDFLTDLAFMLIVGAIITLVFFKIRQPIIVGYLFAGMLLGPLSPVWIWVFPESSTQILLGEVGILVNTDALNLFSEIGVILLLFVIGIEFPYNKIKSIGTVAIGIGTIGLFGTMAAVFYVATALGMSFMDSLFIAAALSISSTAVIVKLLEDAGLMKKKSSIMILGILIVEDIVAVILISGLQSVALADTISVESLAVVLIVGVGLIAGTFTIGLRTIPRLIDRVASIQNREILLLTVLGLCFGYSLLASAGGLSVAIGAFLAGVLVADSKSAEISKILTRPVKDMFVAIFFISTGALMDITHLGDFIWIALILVVVAMVIKFGGNMTGSILFRQKRNDSIRTSTALAAPRGEFSIVIVKAGVEIGAVSTLLFPMIGVIAIITAFMSPFVMKAGEKLISRRGDDD